MEHKDFIDDAMYEAQDVCLHATHTLLQREQTQLRNGEALVSELDPDAVQRQGRSIHPDDQDEEKIFLKKIFTLIRTGKVAKVRGVGALMPVCVFFSLSLSLSLSPSLSSFVTLLRALLSAHLLSPIPRPLSCAGRATSTGARRRCRATCTFTTLTRAWARRTRTFPATPTAASSRCANRSPLRFTALLFMCCSIFFVCCCCCYLPNVLPLSRGPLTQRRPAGNVPGDGQQRQGRQV